MPEAAVPVPVAGVAVTAIGIAVVRARESERADRLYSDPFARLFVDAAKPSFGEQWDQLMPMLDMFYAARTVAVRLVDDHVEAAVRDGIRQIVILGAGLDTRAFRMDLPEGTRFFELDLPETFAFKEPVLANGGVIARYERHVLPVDLRQDWAQELVAQGFRADEPTLWVDEGVLGYLPRPDARRVVAALTELSAPRSRFDIGSFAVDPNSGVYLALRQRVSGAADAPGEPTGFGADIEQWLHEHAWGTTVETWAEQAASVGRPETDGGPETGNIVAIRR